MRIIVYLTSKAFENECRFIKDIIKDKGFSSHTFVFDNNLETPEKYDIIITDKRYNKLLNYPAIIIPPEKEIFQNILLSKIWKDVGIHPPFSILINSKKHPVYKQPKKSLIITDDLEDTIIEIIKQGMDISEWVDE